MERGLYAAATGMLSQQTMQDFIAQNIANAGTIGFKQDAPTFRAVQGMALERLNDGHGRGAKVGDLGLGNRADKVYIDWRSGSLTHTGNPLDASLGDGQFFAIQTPAGERYTRAGDLQLNGAGQLVTSGNLPVLGANNRPITTRSTGILALDPSGNLNADGIPIARLKIVAVDPTQMIKEGDTLFRALTPTAVRPVANPTLQVGTLEQSNMDTVQGLVKLITVSRGFDLAQRAVTSQDELLSKAASEIGKI